MSAGTNPLVKRQNAVAVLRRLRGVESRSFTELSESTRLSRPTVEDAVAELISDGLVVAIAPEPVSNRPVGRPAKRFAFRAEAGLVVACELGVHELRLMLADLDGVVLARSEHGIDAELPATGRLEAMTTAVSALLAEHDRTPAEVWAIAVSTTGIVDANGTVVRSSRLADWAGTDIAGAFERMAPHAAVAVGNDARCAALAEHWLGAGTGLDASVTVLAGTTMAAAITIDGKPYLGRHGASGEIGGLPELGWPRAAAALREFANAGGVLDGDEDERSGAALAEFIEHFALGLITLVTVLDTPRLIIAGELAGVGDRLIHPLQARLDAACLFPVEVVASTLGTDVSVLGALRLALNDVDAWLFDAERERRSVAS
ncbi:ROK family protein [Agromyces sp. NPDC056379]|uniref:ROK family protein n=1 Tax=unclassified Agromyces TaxID=2639701 RepID=UPI0035DDA13E